jgi:hypothetical protein
MANVTGSWVITTDFGCDGSITGSSNLTFKADGTWSSSPPFIHNGRWYQVKEIVVFTFSDVANLVYAANLSGSRMTGVQGFETVGGDTGCFKGHRTGIAAVEMSETANERDPLVGF